MRQIYGNDDPVIVHSFGDGKEYKGRVVGLAMDHITRIYIVWLSNPQELGTEWSCINVPEGCLRYDGLAE